MRAITEEASCSVLAIRRPFQPIRSVLVATEGSSPAHAAVQALLTLPLAPRPRAHVVLVLPRPEELAGGHPELHARLQALRADAWRRQHEAAESVCSELSNRLAEAEILSSWEVTDGDATEKILGAATTRSVDLIVVGSRGRSALVTILLGSVSHAVLIGANCSVLIGR